jgi:hypothetical protein
MGIMEMKNVEMIIEVVWRITMTRMQCVVELSMLLMWKIRMTNWNGDDIYELFKVCRNLVVVSVVAWFEGIKAKKSALPHPV